MASLLDLATAIPKFLDLATAIPKFLSKLPLEERQKHTRDLTEFAEASVVKLDRYYSYWRERLREVSSTNKMISNGWAFSTLSGLTQFETHIRTSEVRSIYFSRSQEIDNTIDNIHRLLDTPGFGNRRLGGIIFYGYGNLVREAHFIDSLKRLRRLSSQKIYLIDCSLFYHIFANSPLNPMLSYARQGQLRTRLIDYIDGPRPADFLKYIRDDLYVMRPVIHFFLGNTFCNVENAKLISVLNTVIRSGDFIVAEYSNYRESQLDDTTSDYASEMAQLAAAELFSLSPNEVISKNVLLSHGVRATQVELAVKETNEKIQFLSMMRRPFSQSELTNGSYELLLSEYSLEGKLRLDTYRKLTEPI